MKFGSQETKWFRAPTQHIPYISNSVLFVFNIVEAFYEIFFIFWTLDLSIPKRIPRQIKTKCGRDTKNLRNAN